MLYLYLSEERDRYLARGHSAAGAPDIRHQVQNLIIDPAAARAEGEGSTWAELGSVHCSLLKLARASKFKTGLGIF